MIPSDPHEPSWVTWLRNPRVRRTFTLLALWLFVAWLMVRVRVLLLPFGLALLLAFILDPWVTRLSQLRLRGHALGRTVSIIGLYAVLLSGLGMFATWAVAQIAEELSGLGRVTKNLIESSQRVLVSALDWAERVAVEYSVPIDRQGMEEALRAQIVDLAEMVSGQTSALFSVGKDVVGGAVSGIFGLFLVLMLTAFLSIDRDRILRFFFTLVPPEVQEAYSTVTRGATEGLAGVVRGQLLICLTNGILTYLGLSLFGIKLPLILATMAGVFSVIPIFGSILSTVPIVAMGLTDSFSKGLLGLVWIIGIHLLEANFLNPRIMGSAARIHPVIVVFVLVVGEHSAGLMGALFAVPIASVVLTVFKFMHQRALNDPELSQANPGAQAEAPASQTKASP